MALRLLGILLIWVHVLSALGHNDASLDVALLVLKIDVMRRNNTVVVTSANAGYLNHVGNLKCFLDKLGLRALFLAMDDRAHEHVSTTLQLNSTFVSVSMVGAGNNETKKTRVRGATDAQRTQQIRSSPQSSLVVEEAAADYHTHQFHIITTRKIEAVLWVLSKGLDVFFIDSDVALLRDPFPYLLKPTTANYIFTSNKMCPTTSGPSVDLLNPLDEGNTGVFYARSTPGVRALLAATIAAAPSFPGLDDQSIFWRVVRRKSAGLKVTMLASCDVNNSSSIGADVTMCPLDECSFSVGALRGDGSAFASLQKELRRRGTQAVTVHANWIKGNAAKAAALAKHGLWLVGDRRCASIHAPAPGPGANVLDAGAGAALSSRGQRGQAGRMRDR